MVFLFLFLLKVIMFKSIIIFLLKMFTYPFPWAPLIVPLLHRPQSSLPHHQSPALCFHYHPLPLSAPISKLPVSAVPTQGSTGRWIEDRFLLLFVFFFHFFSFHFHTHTHSYTRLHLYTYIHIHTYFPINMDTLPLCRMDVSLATKKIGMLPGGRFVIVKDKYLLYYVVAAWNQHSFIQ